MSFKEKSGAILPLDIESNRLFNFGISIL